MKYNAPLRTLIIWAIITGIALFGIFVPLLFGFNIFEWGVMFSDICFYISLIGILIIVVYAGRVHIVDTILKGRNILVHWEYTLEEWQEYTQYQYQVEQKEKRTLFYIITGFIVIIGCLFIFMSQQGWMGMLIGMVVVIILMAILIWFSVWNNYRQNKKYPGETFITENALYINRRLHVWKGLGARLETVNLVKRNNRTMLDFYYSSPTRFSMQNYPVSIPVPEGKEKEAKSILGKFGVSHQINPGK